LGELVLANRERKIRLPFEAVKAVSLSIHETGEFRRVVLSGPSRAGGKTTTLRMIPGLGRKMLILRGILILTAGA
jgi:ABC-type sugar transport system ATPase subunit